jgi:hypothetical protein
MKFFWCKPFVQVFIFIFLFSCSTEQVSWPESTAESKPWTRWWWMGNAVDRENIKRELQEMSDAGIGGIEITSIYGVKGEENRFIEYLTPEFAEILKFTIDEANKLGMGVDIPPGSGWRCGGPFVPEEKGLWSLRMHKFEIAKGESWSLPQEIKTVAAASFRGIDGKVEIFKNREEYIASCDGTVYIAERIKNNDKVKRACEGGEGWAVDTFNDEITNWYLGEFWNRLGIEDGLIRCFFHDSFEYTGDFTTGFTEEFKRRRGYDLAEYLYVLSGDCINEEITARIKSDYRETLSDLVLESFIQPMTKWANNHQSLNRNQAHGSPGNILDLYAASDIPETEIIFTIPWGSRDIFINKYASSASHITGKKLISSESFTWLEEHWTVTTSDMMRATNRFLLAGINHMFFHGTCYSPEDAEWPGWLFYASAQINNRNPLWRELPALFKYIERSQCILQNSMPQSDILVYWPYYDVAASEGRLFKHIGVSPHTEWFNGHPIAGLSEELMEAGYTFDYISDKQLKRCKIIDNSIVTSGNSVYKALVVPKTQFIPFETLNCMQEMNSEGAKVFYDGYLPASVPGIFRITEREKKLKKIKIKIDKDKWTGNIPELLMKSNIYGEKDLSEEGFNFLKIRKNGNDWYMIFNCGTEALDEFVKLNVNARSYLLFYPEDGGIFLADKEKESVRICLEPERSVFIMCSDKNYKIPEYPYVNDNNEIIEIKGLWKLSFEEGGPVFPGNINTNKLLSWTAMGDEHTGRFAGTARYTIEFDWPLEDDCGILDLGVVKDCARVKLNGKKFGTLLGPTYKIYIDNLQKGENFLEIEVTNVAANRIRYMDIKDKEWKKFYDINIVNIDYEPFDASEWSIKEAGLLGPVVITPGIQTN